MADYIEIKARRGRLFYRPLDNSEPLRDYQTGYPPARYSERRPQHLNRGFSEIVVPIPKTRGAQDQLIRRFLEGLQSCVERLRCARIPCPFTCIKFDFLPEFASRGSPWQRQNSTEMAAAIEGFRRQPARPTPVVGGPISGMLHRPSLAEDVRTASQNSVTSLGSGAVVAGAGEERPIASGNGVSLSIALAEPVLFLQGTDQSEVGNQTTTMLRGSFHLRVSKSAKIKSIFLAFRGRAETEWPEGTHTALLVEI